MNLRTDTNESDIQNREGSILACVVYNLINASLLALIYRNATVIRGDGPAGFSELIIKGFITHICLAFFVGGIIASIKIYRASKDRFRLKALCIVTFSVLLFFSAVAVVESCSDDAGHCREWRILSSLK